MQLHINEGTLTGAKLFHYGTDILLGNVDDNVLDGLTLHTVNLLVKHTGVGAAELIALTAHILDKDGEVHFASTGNAEGVGGVTVLYTKGDIAKKLLVKAGTKVTGGNKLTLLTCEGGIVNREGHFHGGLTNLDELKGLNLCGGADGVTDRDILTTGEADDVADLCLGNGDTLQSVKLIDRYNLRGAGFAAVVIVADGYALSLLKHTALDTADTDSTNKLVVVDGGNEELKRLVLVTVGCGHIFKNGVKKGGKILTGGMGVKGSGTRSTGAEEHRGIKLLVSGVKLQKKLKHLVTNLVKTGIGTVDFVYDNDNPVIKLQCLFKHESGLGHGALCRIDKEDNSVYHFKDTLYLATEIGVTGGVDNVDFNILVVNSGILRKDGDTTLTLKVAGVHNSVGCFLIFTVDTALTKHLVNKGCLAVVNVCDDRNISQIRSFHVIALSFFFFQTYIVAQYTKKCKHFLLDDINKFLNRENSTFIQII